MGHRSPNNLVLAVVEAEVKRLREIGDVYYNHSCRSVNAPTKRSFRILDEAFHEAADKLNSVANELMKKDL